MIRWLAGLSSFWSAVSWTLILIAPQSFGWNVEFDGSSSSPVLDSGRLYVGSLDGSVYAFNAKTGEKLWNFQTGEGLASGIEVVILPGHGTTQDDIEAGLKAVVRGDRRKREIRATPLVANGLVYIGSMDHRFYAIDDTTGALRWVYIADSAISRRARLDGTTIVVFPRNGSIHGFHAISGSHLWSVDPIPERLSPGVLSDGTLFVTGRTWRGENALYASFIYAIDTATGVQKWLTTDDAVHDPKMSEVVDGMIYVTAARDEGRSDRFVRLSAIATSTGEKKWSYEVKSRTPDSSIPVVKKGFVYFTTYSGIYAIDAGNGDEKWSLDGGCRYFHVGEALYAVINNDIKALDLKTGKTIWSMSPKSRFGSSPGSIQIKAVADGMLYVSHLPRFDAIDMILGDKVWSKKIGRSYDSNALVSDGMVFFTSESESFVGFGSEKGQLWGLDSRSGGKVRQ